MQIPINLYAIKDVKNDEVIWNANGGVYKDLDKVGKKIKKLEEANPGGTYELICWNYYMAIPVVQTCQFNNSEELRAMGCYYD